MWLDTLIRYVFWLLFFVGLWLAIYPVMIPLFTKVQKRSRYMMKKETVSTSRFIQGISRFLEVTINKKSSFAVYTFLFGLTLIAVLVFTALHSNGRPLNEVILWSLVTPLIPVGFLYFRLYTLRILVSHEGKEMVSELLNNYRIHHHNLPEAIDQTILSLGHKQPYSKRLLMQLSLRLREARNEKETREAVSQMVYSIDAKWAILLANLFNIALIRGDDVTLGLVDISKDLADLEQINEKSRQLNIEGGIMLKILIPILLVGGLYAVFNIFEFTVPKYLEYQFQNSIGFTSFYYTLMVLIGTIMLYLFFRREKNDF